ncbi:GtrA family protein [Chromohalobacter israelensis]|uniref:GtrA family protein n=1 Tax=Chromohalobacter israelensis TaxID=141390 RepID=UPI003D7B6E8D
MVTVNDIASPNAFVDWCHRHAATGHRHDNPPAARLETYRRRLSPRAWPVDYDALINAARIAGRHSYDTLMLKFFTRYASVGVINTLVHWSVFAIVYHFTGEQASSNLVAFAVAVTFSFFANARWTFRVQATAWRYTLFVAFMGILSWGTGKLADSLDLPPYLTLITFSALSLGLGYVYSRYCVFRSVS